MMEHPVITYMERTGWPDGKDPAPYQCPHCDADLCAEDLLLTDAAGNVLGCLDGCVTIIEPDGLRTCETCGEPIGLDDAMYIDSGGDVLGCSECCCLLKAGDYE